VSNHEGVLAGPCKFTGDGVAHGGPTAWVEIACAHGHVERGWGCTAHLAAARDRLARAGSVRCGRCGHVCLLALRVAATGEVAGGDRWVAARTMSDTSACCSAAPIPAATGPRSRSASLTGCSGRLCPDCDRGLRIRHQPDLAERIPGPSAALDALLLLRAAGTRPGPEETALIERETRPEATGE
jgi:hypothetical protein